MKLWWVHNETMIATLMAYQETRDQRWWHMFVKVSRVVLLPGASIDDVRAQVAEYTMTHFPDTPHNSRAVPAPARPLPRTVRPHTPQNSRFEQKQTAPGGEWFGYLTREGAVSQRFKGGPYKGPCVRVRCVPTSHSQQASSMFLAACSCARLCLSACSRSCSVLGWLDARTHACTHLTSPYASWAMVVRSRT
jgi:hypothetical protein